MLAVAGVVQLSRFSFVFLPLETNSALLIAFSLIPQDASEQLFPLYGLCFFLITNGSISKDWTLVAYHSSRWWISLDSVIEGYIVFREAWGFHLVKYCERMIKQKIPLRIISTHRVMNVLGHFRVRPPRSSEVMLHYFRNCFLLFQLSTYKSIIHFRFWNVEVNRFM